MQAFDNVSKGLKLMIFNFTPPKYLSKTLEKIKLDGTKGKRNYSR